MSNSLLGELSQDYLSTLSDLRTTQVFTIIGNVVTTLGATVLNTILMLLTIGVAKAVLLTVVRHFSPEKLEPSRQTCLVKLEDPSIDYSSQEPEYLHPRYQHDIYKYGPHAEYGDVYEEEPVYFVYDSHKKRGQHGFWEELIELIVFHVL